ncbi:Panacea domain-containing protein [Occallatibacter savannae]|uniref:Panacea domain-containing protein n=1 Tax=Occallatibacter savannae TaxID=1002691 RepID=UPI0013A55C19|nr:type II toxin-antitoxin system antitoxin SocA domain-containing protein [Occallatibacter savannae]
MTTTARNLAKFIVQRAGPISNLKLQKLLYYVQGWHLGLHGKPVFHEQIQAWVHGPVVPSVFHMYKEFKWTPITADPLPVKLDDSFVTHTLTVIGVYGKLNAAQLEKLSHQEDPWIHARKGLDPKVPSNAVITHESMKRYFFGKRANG